jgi:hypothetical protein
MYMITGKVILSGGEPPGDRISIQRLCHGSGPQEIGRTDSKGRFRIDLGWTAGEPVDEASERPGGSRMVAEPDLARCELRAFLPGFRSEVVPLAGRKRFDHPDVGTIVLHRVDHVEGTMISATTVLAPVSARKAFQKALERAGRAKLEDARKLLEKAVAIYPRFALAWHELGHLHARRGDFDSAKSAFHQAIAADAKFIKPYVGLARLEAAREAWPEVARITGEALRLNAVDVPEAWILHGIANLALGRTEAADRDAE